MAAGFAQSFPQWPQTGGFQKRRHQVGEIDESVRCAARLDSCRPVNCEPLTRTGVVVICLALREWSAVVARNNDQCILRFARIVQCAQQTAHVPIEALPLDSVVKNVAANLKACPADRAASSRRLGPGLPLLPCPFRKAGADHGCGTRSRTVCRRKPCQENL